MKLIVCKNYDEMSKAGAAIFEKQIADKKNCVLGLATGSTPIGLYKKLAEDKVDFSEVISYNLDEYYPLSPENDQSYRYFMDHQLFNFVNIDKKNTHVLNGLAEDPEKECAEFEKAIENAGGIDLQLLGIGKNGHIGFNEPAEELEAYTHLTGLTESTIKANSRFFSSIDEVPTKALTAGIATIMKARSIVLLASGKDKHEALMKVMSGKITTSCPASILIAHPDCTVICDEEAYNG